MTDTSHEPCFTANAVRIFGQCALLFGWRPDEFWSATPAEVAAIQSALRGPQQSTSVSRTEIDRLMKAEYGR